MSSVGGGDLRSELDEIGSRAAAELRRRDFVRRLREAWLRVLPMLIIGPLAIAAVRACSSLRSSEPSDPLADFIGLAFLTLGGVAGWGLANALRRQRRRPAEADGLARLDRELATQGRLQAAHEFSGEGERSPFMLAAIDDARPHVARASSHRIAADAKVPLPKRAWLVPLASIALCALLSWLAPQMHARVDADAADTKLAVAPAGEPAPRKRESTDTKELAPDQKPPAVEPKPREASARSDGHERAISREPERDPHDSTGKTGEGASADATPASATSDSRGFLSSQSQPSESGEQGKPSTKKPKPPKLDKQDRAQPKKLEASGSTAGKGVGTGSSKNPGATDWQSKDQVSADDEQPLGEDAEVDDEDSESEARGGLQPSLRDRRPAVNRDLQIGFGNQPNPDANGRGGPSEQKKSRGVASLVLGVPIPDHVKGQPNPGRTKITQERVEPRADDAEPIQASARRAREEPIGPLARPELTPWMRELVRAYFLKVRAPLKTETPKPETPSKS